MGPELCPHASLSAVSRTLLIPLVARACGHRLYPNLACDDTTAAAMVQTLALDERSYLKDRPTVLNVLWRTAVLKERAMRFFDQAPEATGVNLGCGLSHHFQWLDNGRNAWLDADLPAVMACRKTLLPDTKPRQRQSHVDLQQPGWWARLGLPHHTADQPVLLIIEGVLMYFSPSQAHAVLHEFAQAAPKGSRILFDAIAPIGLGMAKWHRTVGPTGAEFTWAPSSTQDVLAIHPRLRLSAHRSVAEHYGWLGHLTEACWLPVTQRPLYSVMELSV